MKKARSLQKERVRLNQCLSLPVCPPAEHAFILRWHLLFSFRIALAYISEPLPVGAFSHWIRGTLVSSLGSPPRGAQLVPNAHHLLLTRSLCLDLPSGPSSPHSFSPSFIHVQMELNRFTLGYPTGNLSCYFSKNGPQTTCLQITLQYLLKIQKRSHPRLSNQYFL